MPAARRVTVSNVAKTGVAQPFAKANDEAAKAAAGEDGRPSRAEAEAAVRVLLRWAGDDPDREGLVGTQDRVVRSYEEFFAGHGEDPVALQGGNIAETVG